MSWKEVIKEYEGSIEEQKHIETMDKIRALLEEGDTSNALDLAMRLLGQFTDGFFGDIHDIIRKEVGEEGLRDIIEGIAFGY
jgi:hypothetical protein